MLFTGLESLVPLYPEENELYRGTIAKMYLDGSINSLLEYQQGDHNGISTFESLAAIPFFYVFGPYLFSLKLVPLAFMFASMALWFLFVKRHISTGVAVITALLFIFAPPSFIIYNLTVGFHSVALFFDILAITFFFKMIRNTPRPSLPLKGGGLGWGWYALFGIASGFALWVDNVFTITLITCIVFWFIHDKRFFLKRTFAIFVISFIVGFSTWFYYVIFIRHFQTNFEYVWGSPTLTFYKKFLETLIYKLPYSFCFKDSVFSGAFLNYLYHGIFVMAFAGLIWFQRKPILKMLSSFLPKGWHGQTCLSVAHQIITVESFFLGYIIIFILAFSLSHFEGGYISNTPWHYRFFPPLYPFIFTTIAIGLDKLFNIRKISFKLISCFLVFILISTGIVGLVSQTNIRDFGKGLTFKGYTYKASGPHLRGTDFSTKLKSVNQIDDGLYKNYFYQFYGFKLAFIDKLELNAYELLIRDIDETSRPNCYEGFGYGYAMLYGNVSTILEKLKSTNLMNKYYEKYFLYGITTLGFGGVTPALRMEETVDKHISIISQIDSQFQPYFYQGMGIWLARKNRGKNLAEINKTLLKIDKTNSKYCCIGVGQNFAQRLEWAFADKKYYIGFDGLNKDYWPDCYYGLGWGIGDFFEFDMDRYIAIINNNVSPEYIEYCFKGLADRLRWRFGNDAKNFKKVMDLFPEPYKKYGTHELSLR